jgi:hypothetical protein
MKHLQEKGDRFLEQQLAATVIPQQGQDKALEPFRRVDRKV